VSNNGSLKEEQKKKKMKRLNLHGKRHKNSSETAPDKKTKSNSSD